MNSQNVLADVFYDQVHRLYMLLKSEGVWYLTDKVIYYWNAVIANK